MSKPPAPPYIPAKHHGGKQTRLDRIVLHSTVSDTEPGGARAIASYFQDPDYVSSAHYVVDPGEVIQMVWDHTIAWHDGTNVNSLGVEMCDRPRRFPGRWQGRQHKQLLNRTADLVRQLCLAYDIPMRHLTPAQIREGEKGICSHADMRDAFPGSTSHWDPGHFPWKRFVRLVNRGKATAQTNDSGARRRHWIGGNMIPLEPNGEYCTATLIPPENGLQLVVAVGDSAGGTPWPDLILHNVKQFYGDGSVAAFKDYKDRHVKPGTPANPTWDLEIKPGVVAVRIEYSYTNTVHTATAGFRVMY